jgi:hypothetical protein
MECFVSTGRSRAESVASLGGGLGRGRNEERAIQTTMKTAATVAVEISVARRGGGDGRCEGWRGLFLRQYHCITFHILITQYMFLSPQYVSVYNTSPLSSPLAVS